MILINYLLNNNIILFNIYITFYINTYIFYNIEFIITSKQVRIKKIQCNSYTLYIAVCFEIFNILFI
jgi:hypothetical protein